MPKRRRGHQGDSTLVENRLQNGESHSKKSARSNKLVDDEPVIRVTYRLEHGLRHVEPYDFDFTTHVKGRWVGRTLLEVFAREFVAYSEDYYRDSIQQGRVTVDGQQVTPGHVLQENERIVHRAVSCRESPVLDRGPIPVIAETQELLVVSKPSSLPIHPCGSYRFNSLISLLREQGTVVADVPLHTTHRLDRLTSGLVMLARTKAAAQRVGAWFAQNEIRKTYLARVRGTFGNLLEKALVQSDGRGCDAVDLPAGTTAVSGRIRVRGYNRCVDHKVGKYEFMASAPEHGEEAKDAMTEFECIGTTPDGEESVVRCLPSTGRTHQIRVHLRHLGYPIANDSCYGGELRDDVTLPLIPHVHQACADGDGGVGGGGDLGAAAGGRETKMHPSGIFLHALTYTLPGGEVFSAEVPPWADLS